MFFHCQLAGGRQQPALGSRRRRCKFVGGSAIDQSVIYRPFHLLSAGFPAFISIIINGGQNELCRKSSLQARPTSATNSCLDRKPVDHFFFFSLYFSRKLSEADENTLVLCILEDAITQGGREDGTFSARIE